MEPPGSAAVPRLVETGVLSSAILDTCAPRQVIGVDPSDAFIAAASENVGDHSFTTQGGDGEALPFENNEFAAAVSGLVLNFVPDKQKAVAEMVRVVQPGGAVALYVWDYAGHMQIMRYFFDAAIELDSEARKFDDGTNAPICRPAPLEALFTHTDLKNVEVQPLDIVAEFEDFDDYWTLFLGGTG
jgi:SAM-dependent methyltransferase